MILIDFAHLVLVLKLILENKKKNIDFDFLILIF